MADDAKDGGFWRTLPGVLTAAAGLVTASAGLLVALQQTGLLASPAARGRALDAGLATSSPELAGAMTGARARASAARRAAQRADPRPGASPAAAGAGFPRPLALAGQQVRLGDAVFRVLAADLDRLAPGRLELRLLVRATNDAPSRYLFVGASTFRLVVDSVPQAPTDAFDERVAPSSAQQGKVVFALPDTARAVSLLFRVQNGEVQRALAVELGPARP